jgi:hypothetical protein
MASQCLHSRKPYLWEQTIAQTLATLQGEIVSAEPRPEQFGMKVAKLTCRAYA